MREEDFSVRARGASRDDAMGEVMIEVNSLSETLREQRLGAAGSHGVAANGDGRNRRRYFYLRQ